MAFLAYSLTEKIYELSIEELIRPTVFITQMAIFLSPIGQQEVLCPEQLQTSVPETDFP